MRNQVRTRRTLRSGGGKWLRAVSPLSPLLLHCNCIAAALLLQADNHTETPRPLGAWLGKTQRVLGTENNYLPVHLSMEIWKGRNHPPRHTFRV